MQKVSIKGDIEDIAGDEEISDDYGLTSNNQVRYFGGKEKE